MKSLDDLDHRRGGNQIKELIRMTDNVKLSRWKRFVRFIKGRPNFIVRGLYHFFYFLADFGPMFSEFFRFIGRSSLVVVNIAILVATIAFSVSHSLELLRLAGARNALQEWIGVVIFEVIFIFSSIVLSNDLKNGALRFGWKNYLRTGWAPMLGFLIGFVFVEISNVMGMAHNWFGRGVGIAIPFVLLISKGLLAHQFNQRNTNTNKTENHDTNTVEVNNDTNNHNSNNLQQYDNNTMNVNDNDRLNDDANKVDHNDDNQQHDNNNHDNDRVNDDNNKADRNDDNQQQHSGNFEESGADPLNDDTNNNDNQQDNQQQHEVNVGEDDNNDTNKEDHNNNLQQQHDNNDNSNNANNDDTTLTTNINNQQHNTNDNNETRNNDDNNKRSKVVDMSERRNKRKELDRDTVIKIFLAEGSNAQIAKRFGVSAEAVRKIKNGERHAEVTAPYRQAK